ncbi:DMT family transporter [Caenimonas sedimenti]|uniref:DMT family transporter n=1 Tax=Caenimonas sedimenti TaxID=2596921 RepID=A0A562ZRP7_9BURK|nr:DMT family transporter [Caenimonas sedimenti]TWO70998.1 DMT family transporter [Caenimonas sedimenti]
MAERVGPWPALALVFNAFVWGLSWWPFRELQSQGLHPLWSTALIYLVSLACLLAVRPGAVRGWWQSPWLWLLAAAAGMTNVGFNWAVTIGDVVRVVLLFYLMPAWSVLLAWLLLDEKPHATALARVALALVGVAIVLDGGAMGWPWPQGLADWLALAGGFSFALTNALLRKLQATPPESRVLAMFGGGAALAGTVATWGLAQGTIPGLPALQASWLGVGLALSAAFLVGNLALQYGAARLAAHTTALVMLSEVVFASLSSVALGAAELSPRVLAGGALIVAAAAWSAWPEPRVATSGRTMET